MENVFKLPDCDRGAGPKHLVCPAIAAADGVIASWRLRARRAEQLLRTVHDHRAKRHSLSFLQTSLKHIHDVRIELIPHEAQRYPTAGDWYYDREIMIDTDGSYVGTVLVIRVSSSGDWKSDILVVLHEFVEAMLCLSNGIPQDAVDAWDMAHLNDTEPGADPNCPYGFEHRTADMFERMLAAALNVDWTEHENRLAALDPKG